eukprot:gene7561-9059_t
MKSSRQLHQRDAKKLALTNNARMKRMARRKIENQVGDGRTVTDEMITTAMTQRSINQIDELSRRNSYTNQFNNKQFTKKKVDAITLGQLPSKPLKRNVVWLSLPQQEANANVSLTAELECFARYVQLDEKEEEARVSMLLDIQDAVQSKFPMASISQFGSHPVGLSIFLSDLDISVDQITGDAQVPPPPPLALTSTPKKLSNTALVSSVVRRDSFGSNMSDGTIKRASSLVDNPISKRIKFSDRNSPEQPLTEEMEEDVEVTWSIDNSAGDTASSAAANKSESTAADAANGAQANTAMATRKGPREKQLSSECFDSSDDSDSGDSDYAAGLSEPDEESVNSALEDGENHSEDDYFEDILDGDDDHLDAVDDQSFLDDGEMSEDDDNEDFEGFTEPLQISRTPSSSSLRFDENGEIIPAGTPAHAAASSSTEKKVKLPLDIDVPFWDGANSVNAAQHDTEGVLDEVLAENLYKMDGSAMKAVRMSEQEARKEKLEILAKLYKTIKSMAWVQRIEFRKHARVPILNLTHKNGVECDVSLDMSQQATSLVVRSLLQRSGPALAKLSAFLKIYLNQLGLDAPFTGGLGSYKLYVLLARHIEREPELAQTQALGPLLVSFLKFYSHRKNMHEGTVVEVAGAEAISFDRTQKVNQLRLAFEKAFLVLTKAHIERPADNSAHSYLERQLSSSQLGTLLNTENLSQTRMQMRSKCHKYPHRSEAERDAVARKLLLELHNRVADAAPIAGASASLEEVKASNPALAARLRSFPSASSAVNHLAGVQANLVDTKRGKEMQDIQDLMMGVERPATASASSGKSATAPAVGEHVKLTKTKFIPLPAGSPLQGLEKDCPIFTIQDNKVAQANKTFNPKEHVKIITGQEELPPGMKVPDDVKKKLPDHLQRALGPFRMMCVADTYFNKSYGELLEMKEKQVEAVEKVKVLIESGFFVKCSQAEKDFLRKMVVANLIDENPSMRLDLTKVEHRLQEETREAQVMIRIYMTSRMPTVPVSSAVSGATSSAASGVNTTGFPVSVSAPASSSATSGAVMVVDLTETASDSIPEGSPLYSIQNDFLLFDFADVGEAKFIEKIYATYTTHADLSEAMLRQSLAAGKVKSLFANGYFKRDCTPAEIAFLRKSVLTHLVGEKYDMNLKLTKEERQLICDSAEAHKRVQEYLQYLSQVAQGQAVLTPQQKLEAELLLPFNPTSKVGMQIRQGKLALPVDMVVEPQFRRFLPRATNQHIDIFRTLAEADSTQTMSWLELEALQLELLNRKKPYQKEFDAQNWDFFGKSDAERYPILDALIAENVIAEPSDWTFTKEMRNRQKKIFEREAAFQKLLAQRRAAVIPLTNQAAITVPVVMTPIPVSSEASPAIHKDAPQDPRTSSAEVKDGECGVKEEDAEGEGMEEVGEDDGESDAEDHTHSSSRFANCSELIRGICADIPLLVALERPQGQKKKFNRLSAAWKMLKDITSGVQSLPAQAVVDNKLIKKLPAHVAAALGPFRMLCIAQYCLGKSFDELKQQGEAEYHAVLRLKQLYESGYFQDCSKDDAFCFRTVCLTGLLSCSALPLQKHEQKLQLEVERSSRSIERYANSLSKDKSYPAYDNRYPVVVDCGEVQPATKTENKATVEIAAVGKKSTLFKDVFSEITKGLTPLPPQMIVPITLRHFLPAPVLAELGPFSSLEEKEKFMKMTATELKVYQSKGNAKKALIQKKFDDEKWSYFGVNPHKIETSIDHYITLGMLDLPPGRELTEAQSKTRVAHLQLQVDLAKLIEKRLEDMKDTGLKSASQGKDLGHLGSLLAKRKAEEEERSQQQQRLSKQKTDRVPQAQPIVISGLAKPVPVAKPTTSVHAASAAVSAQAACTSAQTLAPLAESVAAKMAARALISQRLAEERARELKGNKRTAEPQTKELAADEHTAPGSAKKLKVEVLPSATTLHVAPVAPVVTAERTPAAPAVAPSVDAAPVIAAPVIAAPVVAPIVYCESAAVLITPSTESVPATSGLPEYDESDCFEFPSLNKPVVLSGRRGPGRRGSFPLTATGNSMNATVVAPVQVETSIAQESKNIVQEIDEIKQKLDESKRRHSLE